MQQDIDIRWIQRLENFTKAYNKLAIAVREVDNCTISDQNIIDLMSEGLIQRFEYTHELAWNVMKDYEEYQGDTEVRGSRDALRKALAIGLIDDAAWMESINDRNRTSHNYDEEVAEDIKSTIIHTYFPLFTAFLNKMEQIKQEP